MVPMRVVIADDAMLIREGLARLLSEAGLEVVGTYADAEELQRRLPTAAPDVAIVDIRMPPTHTDEGIVAAQHIRETRPDVGVLVLSQYVDSRYAARLLEGGAVGVGYLLKERVSDIAVLRDALRRVDEGECVVDPTIVGRLLRRRDSALAELTDREREVLGLMAEGHSNHAICRQLFLSPKTVEAHIGRILMKLDLPVDEDHHRRVLAVLVHLRESAD